jgi:lipopolysaccharide biosynthesis glycosyltransferase
MGKANQAVVTVASGPHAERLDYTFTSFLKNPFVKLHAFIFGEELPRKRLPEISYHLVKPDPSFGDPMRDMYYRRLVLIDQLEEEFVLLVDNSDVLCLQAIPELPQLLRGAGLAACVEHMGGRYIMGQGYTSEYINCGVTFWHTPSTKQMRQDVVDRGRARFRSVEDQLTFNEVVQTRYYDQMILLPCQYNFRALLNRRLKGWPTVQHLDGILIYHCAMCIEDAKKLTSVRPKAALPSLEQDKAPLSDWEKFWRKVQLRFQPHIVK